MKHEIFFKLFSCRNAVWRPDQVLLLVLVVLLLGLENGHQFIDHLENLQASCTKKEANTIMMMMMLMMMINDDDEKR